MIKSKAFDILDIISITSGILLTTKDRLKETLGYFFQADIKDYQIIPATQALRGTIIDIHPWLLKIDLSELTTKNAASYAKMIRQILGDTVIFPDILTADDRLPAAKTAQPTALQA